MTLVLFDRVDMKRNLVHLLCLCNFSLRDPESRVRFSVAKTVLTSSLDFRKQALSSLKQGGLRTSQTVFHDLDTLEPGMTFNMKQYPNALKFVKKFVKEKKLLYITPADFQRLKELHAIQSYELTAFYNFQLEERPDDKPEFSLVPKKTAVHSVFVVHTKQPVLVLYNPFQHFFTE